MSGQKSKRKLPVYSKKTAASAKVSSVVVSTKASHQTNNIQSKRRIIQNFLLIWLDSNIDESKDDCQQILKQFRSIINTIYVFTNAGQCVHFINQIDHEKTIYARIRSIG